MVDVPPEVDAPQERSGLSVVAIDLVALLARHLPAGIDRARRVFDDEVVGAVGVEVADAHAVDAPHVVAQLDGLVSRERRARPDVARGRGALAPVHNRGDAPSAVRILRVARADEVRRRRDGSRRQPRLACLRPAIDVEADVRWIGIEQAPAQMNLSAARHHRNHASIERLANALGRPSERSAGFVQRIHRVEVQVRRDLFRRERAQHLFVVLWRARRRGGRGLLGWRLLLRSAAEDPHGQKGRDPHRGDADAHARLLESERTVSN